MKEKREKYIKGKGQRAKKKIKRDNREGDSEKWGILTCGNGRLSVYC